MNIQPKVRGFICTTAHPVGCYQEVLSQINYVKRQRPISGPKNVLVIGGSSGYGLASAIVPAFGAGANTIGVFYERPSDGKRTGTAGWYNWAAFEKIAQQEGLSVKSINGDAFSLEIKQRTAELINKKIDLIIYSLAAPRRTHPITGKIYSSVLKPIGKAFTSKTVDPFRREVKEITLSPASLEEIEDTIQVMGGEDWEMWINYLHERNLLAEGLKTIAYSYIGPELTHAIYKEGTIGKAKEHLHETAKKLNQSLAIYNGKAFISINKAVVTQASAAIPVVPLYISLLFKLMKEKGIHEGCIEQMYRLFKDFIYASSPLVDSQGLIRLDDLEMREDIQAEISRLWPTITSDNIEDLTDIQSYCEDFYKLFGFHNESVDYSLDVDPDVKIPSISDKLVTME
jgi:enoyl-[acyl-carrier protein] reductase / trans-2-enoyl-CoA reductase (NAD+)